MIQTETLTGNIVSFDTGNEATEIQGIEAQINPIQNLNGYSKPWVGGAGKNLCPNTSTSGSGSGITRVVNSDGTITLSNASTALYLIAVGTVTLPAGTYIVSGCPTNNNSLTLQVRETDVNGATLATDSGSGATFTLSASKTVCACTRIPSGQTISGSLTVKPMIQLSSVTDATYEPYANVCPISGSTEANITRTGKNLLPYPYWYTTRTANGITFTDNGDGTITVNGTATANAQFLLTSSLPNSEWVGRVINGSPSGSGLKITAQVYGSPWTQFSISRNGEDATITDSGYENIRFLIQVDSGVTVNNVVFKPMIRLSADSPTYEPYNSNTYTTPLEQTVYGGTLDVTTGVLTVDKIKISQTWGNFTNSTTLTNYVRRRYDFSTGLYKSSAVATSISNVAPYATGYSSDTLHFYIDTTVTTTTRAWVYLPTGTSDSTTIEIVYPLATPLTYQLTPQQVELLKGKNNVWASSGNITLTWDHIAVLDEAVMLNGKYIEFAIDGYMTLGTSGRRSIERKLETYSVSTADGEKLKNSVFPSREIRVHYVIQKDTEEELTNAVNQLNNILNQDEIDFVFHDEKDKFFSGSALLDSEPKKYRHAVKGTWTIYCAYPFKRSVETTEYSSETDATISGNSATFAFDYNGTYPAKPKLRAEFASAKVGGDYNEDGDCGFVAFLDPDENIIQLGNPEVIDVDEYNKNSTLINSEFTSLTGWTVSGVSTAQITDQCWNNGAGQTQSYATGTGTLSRTTAGAINFEFDIVHRLCVSQAAQVGTFECYAMNGNDIVVGFSIEKTGSGTAGKVNYILNNNVVGTDTIDLSLYNQHFGFCQRNPVYVTQRYQQKVVTYVKQKKKKKKKKVTTWVTKTRKVQKGWSYTQSNLNSGWSKDEGVVIFSIGNLADRTFKSSDIDNVVAGTVTIRFTGNLNTNAIHSCSMIGKVGVPFAEIPNVFTAGDIVEADCNSANVVLYRSGSAEGHLEPQYGALGNDWEDFEIKAGRNIIRAVWSEWVDEDYKPTIKLTFNEVYL